RDEYFWVGKGLPHPRRLVGRRCDDAHPVGAERRMKHSIFMAFDLVDGLEGGGVGVRVTHPHPRRLVERRGDDARAVVVERRANHNVSMAFELAFTPATMIA